MSSKVLLLLDLQQGIFDRVNPSHDYVDQVIKTKNAARSANLKIIYVTTSFQPGHPEVSPNSRIMAKIASMNGFVAGDPAVAIPSTIAPLEDDIIVNKNRVSPFMGTNLDIILRSLKAEELVIAGISTSGAVLSTIRQASDMDYRLTVLEDLCLDLESEVHRILFDKVFPRQAQVTSSTEWITGL